MPTCYPKDRTKTMREDGSIDPRYKIAGGTLLYNPERDARLPCLYSFNAHSQVHDKRLSKILIHIVNTSIKARVERAKFHKTLEVPLGLNALMDSYGMSLYFFLLFSHSHPFYLLRTPVCLNWRPAWYCSPTPFAKTANTMRRTILLRHGVSTGA